MTFEEFNFNNDLLEGLLSMGYKTPTPVQEAAMPIIQTGKDIIACAQTGTGKTACYLLPILDRIANNNTHQTTALILAPTRELAQQIDQQIEGLSYFTEISSVAIFGGGDGIVYEQQRRAITNKVNILVATPGRLIAHLTSGVLKLDQLQFLVLDEADRMLDMGFQEDIMRIVSYIPKKRQTLLFSATMPDKIRKLASAVLHEPEQVSLAISQPAAGIDQTVYKVHDTQKIALIKNILTEGRFSNAIIFAGTKDKVKEVDKALRAAKIKTRGFHSDLEQPEREEILLKFRNKALPVIIGTDVLSRGIDIEGIELVINYDVPSDPEDYIHRIGRTARAESTGKAITFLNERDQRKLRNIEQMMGREIPQTPLPEKIGPSPEFKPASELNNNKKRNGKKKKPFKRNAPRGERQAPKAAGNS
ncbi:MAG TPA: DEAD/DEAH box helicase [Sphingobacteriaceae bacterium]